MLKVLFFAQIREKLGCGSVEIETLPATVAELRGLLGQRSSLWQETLQSEGAIAAVNQTISDNNAALSDGDEVAFFPPVTGG